MQQIKQENKMRAEQMQERAQEQVNSLFQCSEQHTQFENHMPEKVGTFLKNLANGDIDHKQIEEDTSFAKSIAEAISH